MERADDPDLGPVRWCAGCSEWWPDDSDFFAERSSTCRACDYERSTSRRERRLAAMREASRRYRRSRSSVGHRGQMASA